LPGFVTIGINELLAALGFRFPTTEEVIECPHGAHPAAEKATEEKRRDQNHKAPQQTVVQGSAREGIGEGDQRIQLEEERDRRGEPQVIRRARGRSAKFGAQNKEKKKEKEEYLGEPAQASWGGKSHKTIVAILANP
jgi:hypothetical protein